MKCCDFFLSWKFYSCLSWPGNMPVSGPVIMSGVRYCFWQPSLEWGWRNVSQKRSAVLSRCKHSVDSSQSTGSGEPQRQGLRFRPRTLWALRVSGAPGEVQSQYCETSPLLSPSFTCPAFQNLRVTVRSSFFAWMGELSKGYLEV